MKNFIVSIILLSFLTIIISCGGSGGSDGEEEPNNSIEQANAVEFGTMFSLSISPKGDTDWLKVEVPEQGYLKVQANQIPEGIVPEVRFALFQEWEGRKDKELQAWRKIPAALHVREPGTYYLEIIDDYNDAESEQEISIKVEFVKEFDSNEFNDSPEEAKEITSNSDITPAIYPLEDNDWFKFKAEKQGYLKIMTKDVPEGIVPEVKYLVFDEWSDPKTKDIREWHTLPDACFIPKAGEYYIVLIDNYNDACSETPFKMKFEFVEETDKGEPNDNFTDAKAVQRGDTVKLMIFPKGDNDYYKINIKEGNKLKFSVKDFAGIKPMLKLFVIDSTETNKLKDYSDWSEFPKEFDVEAGIEYYILISDDYNDASSEKLFEIKIE